MLALPNSFAKDLPSAIVPPLAAAVADRLASPILELSPTKLIILPNLFVPFGVLSPNLVYSSYTLTFTVYTALRLQTYFNSMFSFFPLILL